MPRRSRRRWSPEFKKRVIAEASQPGVSTAEVARRYDLNDNLLFNWKKKFGTELALIPVDIVANASEMPPAAQRSSPCVEIDLPCGSKVQFNGDISSVQLTAIIAALRARR